MNDKEKLKKEFKSRIYKYILRLVKFVSALPRTPVILEIIRQLMRSGTSIGANYFEAYAASSKRDFQNFFRHSLKSANETLFWLAVLKDSSLLPKKLENECIWLLGETKQLAKIFASSIITMKGNR